MQFARTLQRTLGAAVAAAGIALAASQSACNDVDYRSPTVPPQPASVVPVVTGTQFILLIEPTNPDASYPRAGEVLVDGQVIWAGPMGEPGVDDVFSPYNSYYYYSIPFNINTTVAGALSSGAHTLSFRVTDQGRSPTRYTIGGAVFTSWNTGAARRLVTWEAVEVRLATGQEWTAQFIVPQL